jgi:hypothetical protein
MTRLLTARRRTIAWERGIELACILSSAAIMSACGEDASTPATSAPGDDTASAYEALSASLQACEMQHDACLTAAGSDAAKTASCETDAAGCKQKTEAAAEHARENLARDTNSCWKRCRHDDDAGAIETNDDDGGTEDMHGCIEHHTPGLPNCVVGLLSCLHAGVKSGNASRGDLVACIQKADACFRDEFAARREAERGHRGHGNEAGKSAAGSPAVVAGSPAPAAGHPAPAAGSSGTGGSNAGRGDKNPWNRGRH